MELDVADLQDVPSENQGLKSLAPLVPGLLVLGEQVLEGQVQVFVGAGLPGQGLEHVGVQHLVVVAGGLVQLGLEVGHHEGVLAVEATRGALRDRSPPYL